jgi:integrase
MSRRSGQILARGDKKWLVRWTEPRDESTGKWKRRAKIVRGTKKKADAYLAQQIVSIARGAYVTPTRQTLGSYFDEWHAARESRGEVSEATLIDDRRKFTRYVRPSLGGRRLEDLRPRDLSQLYSEMMAKRIDSRGRERPGVGPRTVTFVHGILRAALRDAVREDRLVAAVTDRVRLPRQAKREVRALAPDEVKRFRDAAKRSSHSVLFDFLLGTGARPGEALAVRWSDVDLDAGIARIARALSRPGGRYVFRDPKTERSKRALALADELVRALREHRRAQAAQRLKLGPVWEDHDLVFPGPIGGPADELAINRRAFKTTLKRATLPAEATLYSLRHTFATLALAAGASVHEVASAMGHTSPQLVLSTYGHALPKRRDETFSKVGSIVFG